MKKLLTTLLCTLLTTITLSVSALSFSDDTIFLDANDKQTCQQLDGYFTEWYGEIYCTTTPDTVLNQREKNLVQQANTKIITILNQNNRDKQVVIDLLYQYKDKYSANSDIKRIAIVNYLITLLRQSATQTAVPAGCTVRYDGCNTCMVGQDGDLACTRMACDIQGDAMCETYTRTLTIADHTAECTGVAPQTCLLAKVEDQTERTYLYDDIQGFEYVPGYEYTIIVEEHHLNPEDIPADGSSITWTLQHISKITPKEIPADCKSRYDGCNSCMIGDDGSMMCTLMYCEDMQMPYCQDEGSDNTAAKAYNDRLQQKMEQSTVQ